jgi:hypothetical protein
LANINLLNNLNLISSNLNSYCQDLSIYSEEEIVGKGNFNLVDDKTTTINLNPPARFDPLIQSSLSTVGGIVGGGIVNSPGSSGITVSGVGSMYQICINNILTSPTSSDINTGKSFWLLPPGSYQISDSILDPRINNSFNFFCGEECDNNPRTTVNIISDATIPMTRILSQNPNYYDELGVFSNQPYPKLF